MGSLISGVVDVSAAIDQGKAEGLANDAQLQRDYHQANVAIEGARTKAAFEAGKMRMLGMQVAAKQRVAYANSGVDSNSGTAASVQSDTVALSELDAQMIAINAAREIWGYREVKKQAAEDWTAHNKNINRKMTYAALGGLAKGVKGIFEIGKMAGDVGGKSGG